MSIKNKTTKLISSLLIISIIAPAVLFSTPKQVEADLPVTDIGNTIVNTITSVFSNISSGSTVVQTGQILKTALIEIGKELLKVAAKRLLAQMTQATINWINSGFHGAPLFIENPESFFRDVAKSQIKSLVDLIGYDTFRFPFGPQTALNVIDSYKRQLSDNAQYTLSKVINDPDLLVRYRNDFNYGGWNGFLINTQYPQNNYLGFNMIIQQNLASRLEGTLQAPAQKVQSLLQQGMGFLSPQTCPSNPNYNNGTNEFQRPTFKLSPGPADESEEDYLERYRIERERWYDPNGPNVCPGGLVSTTPGSVAANQVFGALNVPFLSTALDGALGNSLAAIFDALLNHFLDQGLTALSSTISSTPTNDNWSYNGQTLTGGTTIVPGALNIPQNVSVSVGQGTSTTISGGTAPYNIVPQTPASRAIATATISTSSSTGPRLTVVGVAPGTTAIVVHDSSTPSKTVSVTVTVNAVGVLVATPPSIAINVNSPTVVSISGGEGNYTIQASPNEQVAIAVLSDTNLIITGVAPGTTFVEIKDSSTVPKTVRINITIIDPTAITVSQPNVLAYTGQTASVNISGGTRPYFVVGTLSPGVATATISGDVLIVSGQSPGDTSVIFRDSSLSPKTANVLITVINPLIISPQNISVNRSGSNSNRTRIASITGGTAPYTVLQTSESATIANATISGSRLTVTGNTRGETTILVKDSSVAHPQTFTVNVTVN